MTAPPQQRLGRLPCCRNGDTEQPVRLQAMAVCESDPVSDSQRGAATFNMVIHILDSSEIPHEYIDGFVLLAAECATIDSRRCPSAR